MFIVVPLWFAVLVWLIANPVYGLKMIAALLLGLTIGVGFWVAVIAAYGGAG